jgi:hypothetical protein
MIAMVEDGQARKRGAVVEGRKVWLLLLENDKEDNTMRGEATEHTGGGVLEQEGTMHSPST